MNTVELIECRFTFVVAEGKLSINIINYLATITKAEIFLSICIRVVPLVFAKSTKIVYYPILHVHVD